MIDGYKVVTITPVGRRRYIELLHPYLLQNKDVIDKHIFWVNTNNTYDISYALSLSMKYSSFFEVANVNNISEYNNKYDNGFFMANNEEKTIYIKIADDTCWIHPEAITRLVRYCIRNPHFYMVYPYVFNAGKLTMFQQIIGDLPLDLFPQVLYKHRDYTIPFELFTSEVSEQIHNNLLGKIAQKTVGNLMGIIQQYIVYNYEFIPTHAVCWNGNKTKEVKSGCNYQLINFLSELEPKSRGEHNVICGDALMAHFAYNDHEDDLYNKTDIYAKYKELSQQILRKAGL